MNFQLIIEILRARMMFIAFVVGITLVAAVFFTLQQTKKYSASTSLVLTFTDAGPFEQMGVPTQLAGSYMATQVDIISNQNVALKVVDALGLGDDPVAAEEFMQKHKANPDWSSEGLANLREVIAESLRDDLDVSPSRESRVLNIRFASADPATTALVADQFAQSYIDVTLELSMEPARRNAAWFDSQLKVLQSRLEEQQQNLTDYQQERGIVAIDERLDTETRTLEDLSSKLTAAQEATYDVRSRQLGEEHPEYKRALQQERSLEGSLQRQKEKVLEVKKERAQLDLMLRDLENTRSMYDAAIQRYYETSLESQFNQTNIAVLSRAVVPEEPTSPKELLNMALALILGLAFGVGLTILAEVFNRRVRIEDDIKEELGIPVLASL